MEYLDENSGQKIVVDHQTKCYEDSFMCMRTRGAHVLSRLRRFTLCVSMSMDESLRIFFCGLILSYELKSKHKLELSLSVQLG